MKALVYHGPGQRGWDTVDDPTIVDPTDIVVRIDSSTICGTDLHILKGDVPETTPGTVLGHEAVGTVQETGTGVSTVAPGDRVLISCITSCGRCRFCKEHRYGQCLGGGGWIFGHTINGLQAEYARVPFADNSVYKLPDHLSDEQVLFLADILPTSFEVGVLNGMVSPGDVVAIVGAGPVGLAGILTAKLYTPGRIVAIDLAASRLQSALEFGADTTINNGSEDAVARIMELTDGLGADVAFEAVGVPETFELATELIRPGGRVANIGVHGHSATLHLEKLWGRDVTITSGLVDTYTIPQLWGSSQTAASIQPCSPRIGSHLARRWPPTTRSLTRQTPTRSRSSWRPAGATAPRLSAVWLGPPSHKARPGSLAHIMLPLRSPSKGAARGRRTPGSAGFPSDGSRRRSWSSCAGSSSSDCWPTARTWRTRRCRSESSIRRAGSSTPGEDIQKGQQVFLHNGLMEYGSAFGHGAYLGPDFTADYLRRSSDLVRRSYGGAASDSPGARRSGPPHQPLRREDARR